MHRVNPICKLTINQLSALPVHAGRVSGVNEGGCWLFFRWGNKHNFSDAERRSGQMHAGVARLRQMGHADVTLSSFQPPATCGSRAGAVRLVCESSPSVLLPIWVCVEAVRKRGRILKGRCSSSVHLQPATVCTAILLW